MTEVPSFVNRPATNMISLKSRIKAAAINAYCHGLMPAKLTRWIIQKGGLRHD